MCECVYFCVRVFLCGVCTVCVCVYVFVCGLYSRVFVWMCEAFCSVGLRLLNPDWSTLLGALCLNCCCGLLLCCSGFTTDEGRLYLHYWAYTVGWSIRLVLTVACIPLISFIILLVLTDSSLVNKKPFSSRASRK